MSALKISIDDGKVHQEGVASDANTMVEKPASEVEKSDIEVEKTGIEAERTDVEGDNSSRNAPSAEVLAGDTLAPSDYPQGFQFFFILLALILSIFMVALDLVRSSIPPRICKC